MNKTCLVPLRFPQPSRGRQVSHDEHLSQPPCLKCVVSTPFDGNTQNRTDSRGGHRSCEVEGCVRRQGATPGPPKEAGSLRERVRVWVRSLRPSTQRALPQWGCLVRPERGLLVIGANSSCCPPALRMGPLELCVVRREG